MARWKCRCVLWMTSTPHGSGPSCIPCFATSRPTNSPGRCWPTRTSQWRAGGADDWGLLDALNQMLTLRATSREHALRNDSPPVRDAAFWAKLDKDLEFYYEAQYPGEELETDDDEDV